MKEGWNFGIQQMVRNICNPGNAIFKPPLLEANGLMAGTNSYRTGPENASSAPKRHLTCLRHVPFVMLLPQTIAGESEEKNAKENFSRSHSVLCARFDSEHHTP
jgi:hypothetical protein